MRASVLALAMVLMLAPGTLHAQRADLPPVEKVNEALDNHPTVMAAAARVEAARARGDMLRRGTHEATIAGSYIRRSVDREGGYDEFDATLSRPFRLPGKAALDRESGALGVEVAENQMEDARHQAALVLSGLWHDWLTAGSHYRNDLDTVRSLEAALTALRRRVQLRDASALDLDQASAALAQAQAQAAASLSAREQARVILVATFPEIPLPPEPAELALPERPLQNLETMRALVVERSHEIRAADREAQRLAVVARRVRADRIADPSFGVRLFSERSGMERGAGVVASIPLGGGYRRAAADQASAEANAARLELANIQRSVAAIADADLSNARTRLEAWRSAQASAQSASDAAGRTERGYQLGQIDLVDLLYARRQANDARRSEIDARSEASRALLKLQIDSHSIWVPEGDHD
ncbi:Outer membrane protein TolC [Sphingomonas sp. OV641]|uniref:TolC family protein n=1 Tax=Sandaracinobacter neustonicus TaxID=1715348 RepID=A0A501XVD6_9SPHN|nr:MULTISPECIES: TolC family protein [Sphingomonadales]QDK32977.1 TolC family protein [Sphingomonas sp. IC081]TPE64419.1 TolC family protein [Sandaracinobacter neustonicus]SEI81366.1 Outer membrane protein TolC [Sphingomonas sp. OV641]